MRLVRIKPTYFRGIGDSDWINTDAQLVVLYGPNGFGKTSLTEAIEWLLYGKTNRRERGETLSQRDYQGSYRNAHAPDESITAVEAVVRLHDGTEHTIRRELQVGARRLETSVNYIDGNEADINSLGVSPEELFNPVIAQHSLQDFIHSRPIDRRDKISAALGLEPLVRYKANLDRARTRFQNNPPQQVVEARSNISQAMREMLPSENSREVALRWRVANYDITQDVEELENAARTLLNIEETDSSKLKSNLEERRKSAAARVFDDSDIKIPSDTVHKIERYKQGEDAIREKLQDIAPALDAFCVASASKYTKAQLEYWKSGLSLKQDEIPDLCPMCEKNTLTTQKIEELQQRLVNSEAFLKVSQELNRVCSLAGEFISSLQSSLSSLLPVFLKDDNKQKLLEIFSDDLEPCSSFLEVHDAVKQESDGHKERLLELQQQIRQLPDTASNPVTIEQAQEVVSQLSDNLIKIVTETVDSSSRYQSATEQFMPSLESRISKSEEIRNIDGILIGLNAISNIPIIYEYERLLEESLTAVRAVERHIQNKQTELFGARGKEINDWYDMMNPSASVRYSRMEPGTDNLTLWADTFGVEINAVACLSESQMNCLGLSVHFMRSMTTDNPFDFIVLDDPVQSMDEDHTQTLILDVVNELLDTHGRQIIICSHVQGLVDAIWDTYLHVHPIRLRISDYQQSGPIVENAETLMGTINRAQSLTSGNEDNRRLATKTLRRCVELLVREICRQTASTPPPHDAMAKQMMPFFEQCPGTTPQQAQRLRATINFANPAPHAGVGWPVPTEQQLIPHIGGLRTMAQNLNIW